MASVEQAKHKEQSEKTYFDFNSTNWKETILMK